MTILSNYGMQPTVLRAAADAARSADTAERIGTMRRLRLLILSLSDRDTRDIADYLSVQKPPRASYQLD